MLITPVEATDCMTKNVTCGRNNALFVCVDGDRWRESDGRKIFTAVELPATLTLHTGSTKVNSRCVAFQRSTTFAVHIYALSLLCPLRHCSEPSLTIVWPVSAWLNNLTSSTCCGCKVGSRGWCIYVLQHVIVCWMCWTCSSCLCYWQYLENVHKSTVMLTELLSYVFYCLQNMYMLKSLMLHLGGVSSSGHYVVHMQHGGDVWLCHDDDKVCDITVFQRWKE